MQNISECRPAYVCILVHGTFARGAAWTGSDSTLRQHLVKQLGPSAIFKRFLWSGTNSHGARIEAATQLARFVRCSTEEFPDSPHVFIAHSHGGNVALYALRDQSTSNAIAAIVCMGTPFICCERRNWQPLFLGWAQLILPVLIGLLAIPPIWLTGAPLVGIMATWWLWPAAFADAVFIGLLICIYRFAGLDKDIFGKLQERLAAKQRSLVELLELPSIPDDKLLIVSARGDEALWWLTRLTRWSELPFFFWGIALRVFGIGCLILAPVAMIGRFETDILSDEGSWFLWFLVGFGMLAVGFLLLLAAMVCLPFVIRGRGIGFGGEGFTYNLIMRIRPKRFPADTIRFACVSVQIWISSHAEAFTHL